MSIDLSCCSGRRCQKGERGVVPSLVNRYGFSPDLLFVEDLHGEVLSRFFVLDQHDSSEGARAQRLQPLELVQRRSVLGKRHHNA